MGIAIAIAIGILNLESVMWSLVFFFTCLGAARTPPPGRFFFSSERYVFSPPKVGRSFFSLSITNMFVHSLIMWNYTAALLLNIFPGLPDPIYIVHSVYNPTTEAVVIVASVK
jgi:hypothetical protein